MLEKFFIFIDSVVHSTPQGLLGVAIIFIYFAVMLLAIAIRIKKKDHMHHSSAR